MEHFTIEQFESGLIDNGFSVEDLSDNQQYIKDFYEGTTEGSLEDLIDEFIEWSTNK